MIRKYNSIGICTIIGILLVCTLSAQIEITPMAGYMFGGSIRGYEGEIKILDKGAYGGTLGWEVAPGIQGEFTYLRQSSEARIRNYGVFESEKFTDMVTQYFLIGAHREAHGGEVRPYGSVGLGTAVFSPKDSKIDNQWFFAASFAAGLKAYVSDQIGIKFHGRLLVPMLWGGTSIWCGTGGCSLGVGSYATIVQGDFSAGIVFRFGD